MCRPQNEITIKLKKDTALDFDLRYPIQKESFKNIYMEMRNLERVHPWFNINLPMLSCDKCTFLTGCQITEVLNNFILKKIILTIVYGL